MINFSFVVAVEKKKSGYMSGYLPLKILLFVENLKIKGAASHPPRFINNSEKL